MIKKRYTLFRRGAPLQVMLLGDTDVYGNIFSQEGILQHFDDLIREDLAKQQYASDRTHQFNANNYTIHIDLFVPES